MRRFCCWTPCRQELMRHRLTAPRAQQQRRRSTAPQHGAQQRMRAVTCWQPRLRGWTQSYWLSWKRSRLTKLIFMGLFSLTSVIVWNSKVSFYLVCFWSVYKLTKQNSERRAVKRLTTTPSTVPYISTSLVCVLGARCIVQKRLNQSRAGLCDKLVRVLKTQGPSETFQGMSWFSGRGTKIVGGVRGVYLIPYTTRFHELQFFTVYGKHKKEKKEIDCFRHSLSTHFEYCLNNWTA